LIPRNPESHLDTHKHVEESEGIYEVTLRVVDDSNEAAETKMLITQPTTQRNANSDSLQR